MSMDARRRAEREMRHRDRRLRAADRGNRHGAVGGLLNADDSESEDNRSRPITSR